MKKIILIAFLGLFVFAAAASFANGVNALNTNPIVQTDDDPTQKEKAESEEQQSECQKKCEKSCENKCCKKENSSCSHEEKETEK
ncbi:MAG: hypothetical protein JW801_12430 [Bacteroidales bacterium]|nr:hypothetical protein [Bacteroidales bacterium]